MSKLTEFTTGRWVSGDYGDFLGLTPEERAEVEARLRDQPEPNIALTVGRGALALILAGLVAVAVAAGVALWGPGRL